MNRTRRIKTAVVSLAASGMLAVGALAAAPAHAATPTFRVSRTTIGPASQTGYAGGSVKIYNGDSVAHRVVSYTANWHFDVVLQPGQSAYPRIPGHGGFGFRSVDHSSMSGARCLGACAWVTGS